MTSNYENIIKRVIDTIGIFFIIGGCFIIKRFSPGITREAMEIFETVGFDVQYSGTPSNNPKGYTIVNPTPIKIPYFIPTYAIDGYLTFKFYSPEHIAFTANYCPYSDTISHLDNYCAICNPNHVKLKPYDPYFLDGKSAIKEYIITRNRVNHIFYIQTHSSQPEIKNGIEQKKENLLRIQK